MEVKPVPELQAQIESTAKVLVESSEDSLEIEGADNKILVKAETNLAKKLLSEERALFPLVVGGKEYLICIKEVR